MRVKRTGLLFALSSVLLLAVVACGEEGAGGGGNGEMDTSQITFGAAAQGGFWYSFAGALGNRIEQELDSRVAVVEGGSEANIEGIANDQFQIALTNGQTVPEALEGFGAFDEPVSGFSGVGSLYPNPMNLVVRADSNIETVEDLEGARVSPGIRGYSGELAFQEILEHNNMSYDDLSQVEYVGTSDAANQLRDGQLDALALMLVEPSSTLQELDATVGIDLIPVPEETTEGMIEDNPGYDRYQISSDTYSTEEDIPTVSGESVVIVHEDLPEDYVYEVTRLIIENSDEWANMNPGMEGFDAAYAQENLPEGLPLHPGAERYYEEAAVR